MLDEVRRVTHHAGHENQVVGNDAPVLLPHRPLVLVTGVRSLEGDLADVGAEHGLQNVLQLDVGGVGAVPRAPAEVQTDLLLRQARDRLVDRVDADLREREVVLDRGLRVDLIPVLGERRIVELHDQARVGDGPVLLAQRRDPRIDVRLLRGVEVVLDARGRARRDRRDEPLLARLEGGPQVAGVGLDEVVARVGDRIGGGGEGRRVRARADAVLVRLGEADPVAAVGERGQLDVAGRRAHRLLREDVALGDGEPRGALERVRPPGAVVDRVRHRLAELAVARLCDAEVALARHNVAHGLRDERVELGRRLQGQAVVGEGACGVRLDEGLRAGQAPRGGGFDLRHTSKLSGSIAGTAIA